MSLQPLGDRVLITPDVIPTRTASGIELVEHWPDEVTGRVAAIGRQIQPRRAPEVAVGDRVLFGRGAGQEVTINETRYFVMRETDLLAVLETA
jgi:chaperonin GroES